MDLGSGTDTSGGSSHPVPDEYSALIGAVVTQQMLQEEKFLEEKATREEKEMKEQMIKQQKQELEEVCYKRLNLLLNRSSLYAKFMADKLERDRLKESKKQKIAEKKKSKSQTCEQQQHPKDTTNSSRKKRPHSKVDDDDDDDIENDIPNEKKTAYEGHPTFLTGAVMHPYQIEGFEWIKVLFENGVNGILADEMGLGKTIQTIAFIAYLIEMGVSGPFLVCVPLSTVPNWYAEFKRFTPSIPVIVYHGTKDYRSELRPKFRKKIKNGPVVSCPVVITSYHMVLFDASILKSIQWKLLVIDEAHRIKNYQCKLVAAMKSINTMHRLLLTGTPLQNNLSELWSLLNFILPEIFDDLKVFESWFDIARLTEGGTDEIIAKEQEKKIVSIIHEILSPFLLRRTKSEVQLKLPPKKEVIVHAPLTKLQQEYYTAVLNKTIASTLGIEESKNLPEKRKKTTNFSAIFKMFDDEDFEIPDTVQQYLDSGEWSSSIPTEINEVLAEIKLNIRNTSMILRKICNHPYLLSYPLDPQTQGYKIDEDLIKTSGKFLVMDQILPELKKRNHKILLFSQFVIMLDILEDYCTYRGYSYCLIKGQTKLEDREKEIKRFNESEDVFIFLISTRAGGLGLNLPAADTVIIYDSDWNPQGDIQAQDRCHRIGQSKPVVVYRLIIPNTVDERIINRANVKRKLEKVIIKKGRFNSNSSMNKFDKLNIEELLELLQSSDSCGFIKTDDNNVLSPEELQKLLDRTDMVELFK